MKRNFYASVINFIKSGPAKTRPAGPAPTPMKRDYSLLYILGLLSCFPVSMIYVCITTLTNCKGPECWVTNSSGLCMAKLISKCHTYTDEVDTELVSY